MQNRRQIGTEEEALAAEFLEGRGYRIVERNFRCRLGEIDLIARDGSVLVFIEVKYRNVRGSGGGSGLPEAAEDLQDGRLLPDAAADPGQSELPL